MINYQQNSCCTVFRKVITSKYCNNLYDNHRGTGMLLGTISLLNIFACRPGQIARPMPIGYAHFFLVKRKKTLDLQVFSRKGKTIKKLQLIPNTIMNINVLACLIIMIYGVKTTLSTHGLGKI